MNNWKYRISISDNLARGVKEIYVFRTDGDHQQNLDVSGAYINTSFGSALEPLLSLPINSKVSLDRALGASSIDSVMIKEKDKHSNDLMDVIKLLTKGNK